MTDFPESKMRYSRRFFLSKALGSTVFLIAAVGTVAQTVTSAEAQEKQRRPRVSKTVAKYQSKPKGDQRCAGCMNFRKPNACARVTGRVSPDGWCKFWEAA